jgi:glycosyltransferase involved in cell wall biosynthesis
MSRLPTITVVTPTLNQAEYLEAAMLSVLSQGYPGLQYVVVDGGSVDHSVEIIRRYEDRLHAWISEPDQGHYDAVRKGFELAPTGEIMAWLNADDLYFPWALRTVASIMSELPEVQWLTTLNTVTWDEEGRGVAVDKITGYSREAFLDGYYVPWGTESNGGWIQQESTFWTRELWEAAGGHLDLEFGLAADFALWCRLYDLAPLYATPALLGGFRRHAGNQRSADRETYLRETDEALRRMRRRGSWKRSRVRDAARRLRLARFPRIGRSVGCRLGYTAEWVVRIDGRWRIDRPRFLDRSAFESFG